MGLPQNVWLIWLLALSVCARTQSSIYPASTAPASSAGLPVQRQPGPAKDDARLPTLSEGLFHLDVIVTDQSGRPATGLDATDFKLLDEGHPSKILSFVPSNGHASDSHAINGVSASADPPVEVILVIDTIELPARLVAYENKEVDRFLRQNSGHLPQPVTILGLSNQGLWTLGASTSDGITLAEELLRDKKQLLVHRKMGTRTTDSFGTLPFEDPPGLTALKALGQIAVFERQKPGRKLLLWVGPGWGLGSGRPFSSNQDREQLFNDISWFSTLLREARIMLYSFSVGEPPPEPGESLPNPKSQLYREFLEGVRSQTLATIDNMDRRVLAIQSGGRVLDPTNDLTTSIMYTGLTDRTPVFDLVAQIDSCVQEAGSFYTLSFNPAYTEQADEYHDLKVEIDKPDLTARTNTGYYNQPYFYDWPRPTVRHITIAQLRDELTAAHGKRDAKMAQDLADIQLTEPLSDAELSALQADLQGAKSKAALLALADASNFLDPPAPAQPDDPPPDTTEQTRILALAADYLSQTFPKLPNLFATRTTVRYQEIPEHYDESGRHRIAYQPLQRIDTSKATVLYRNGTEVVDPLSSKSKLNAEQKAGLIDRGSFGPILGAVTDAISTPGSLIWNRWEHKAGGRIAVFRYAVREQKSRFQVAYCCLPTGYGGSEFRMLIGHHGEIAIDPATGAILRVVVEADLKPNLPMMQASTLVDYGPVDIGGKTYICPVKSISLTRYRTVKTFSGLPGEFSTFGPYASSLNDVTFSDYHAFRSQARILPGFDPTVQK